jgi:hypothetical protein
MDGKLTIQRQRKNKDILKLEFEWNGKYFSYLFIFLFENYLKDYFISEVLSHTSVVVNRREKKFEIGKFEKI